MNNKYLVYLRKSRSDGDYETIEDILEKHEKIIQEFALKNFGNTIQEDFIFREIVSGETIQDRPVIKKLLNIIQNENIEGVLTIEPQRLSRGDMSDCGTIIRAFRYTDTLIITPTKTYDLTDKFDRKFFEMELMKGNDYLEYIKEIMMRGRIASINEGNFIGSVPPYGYDKIKNGKSYTLVPNYEANTLRLIFELFTNENLGTTNIANRLNDLGIKPRKAPYWTNASIRDMLRNPVYIGKIRWNWRKSIKKYENGDIITSRPKSASESWIIIEGKHEPIIPAELFQKAQQRFGNTPRTKAKKEIVNQFAGIIRCECGKAMVQQFQRNGIKTRIHCPHQKTCRNKSSTYEDLEQVIIETLNNIINDFKSKLNNKNTDYNIQSETINNLKKELNILNIQQNKLYELLEQGIYTSAVFVMRNESLAQKRKKLETALAEATELSKSYIDYQEMTISVSEAINIIKNPNITPKRKNAFLHSVIKEIVYKRKKDNSFNTYNPPISISVTLKY